jgi:hypothetical protein
VWHKVFHKSGMDGLLKRCVMKEVPSLLEAYHSDIEVEHDNNFISTFEIETMVTCPPLLVALCCCRYHVEC